MVSPEGGEFAEPGPVEGWFGSGDAGPLPWQEYPEGARPDGAADWCGHPDRLAVDADQDLRRVGVDGDLSDRPGAPIRGRPAMPGYNGIG